MPGPCGDLIVAADVESCCDVTQYDDVNPPSDALLADAVAVASRVAWTLAGRRHGSCQVTGERPARRRGRDRCQPLTVAAWAAWHGCTCNGPAEVALGHSPVTAVDDVRIGGVSLAAADYALVGSNRLVRRDGGRWPACQLLDLPDTSADVLVVDYTWGVPLDAQGVRAVAALGCEFVKACLPGDVECRLPQAVRSVTRQGVSLDLVDPFDFLNEGRTGVYEFDLWLRAVNPHGASRPSRVRTPDVAHATGTP